jgi:hypothetical protein
LAKAEKIMITPCDFKRAQLRCSDELRLNSERL